MKNKILILSTIIISITYIVLNIYDENHISKDSDLMNMNIEALADWKNEGGVGSKQSVKSGRCVISRPGHAPVNGDWYDCEKGESFCIQGCQEG